MNPLSRDNRRRWKNTVRLAGLTGLLLSGVVQVCAAEEESLPVERFRQANALYEQKEYAEAEALYRSILAAGVENSSLHYNLGNCCFKQGKLGRAIASYLRAQRMAPRDADIEQNLKYARSFQIDQEFSNPKPSFTAALFQGLRDRFTLREQLAALLLVFWAGCIAWAGYLRKPGAGFLRTVIWVLLILYVLTGGVALSKYLDLKRPVAVIVSPSATVTSGPDTGTALFTLHEGTTTRVRRRHGEWVQVSLPNGPTGWVKRSHLEFV